MSDKTHGILLFDEACNYLDEALTPYIQIGPIGKYIYCNEAETDGIFFIMSFTPEQVDHRIDDPVTVRIPIRFVKFWVTQTKEKGIPGFFKG